MNCKVCESIEVYESDTGFLTCFECGSFDVTHPKLILEYQTVGSSRVVNSQVIIYHRLGYFTELLNCMTLRKRCHEPDYKKMINILKTKKELNIRNIKKHVKKNNMQKYNKFIYGMYFDIFDVKLIKLSLNMYNKVLYEFRKYNNLYKKTKKRNQFHYHFIMFKIFEKLNIPTEHLLLPKTKDILESKFNLLYNNIE